MMTGKNPLVPPKDGVFNTICVSETETNGTGRLAIVEESKNDGMF
jgi:hypothetical protein